MKDILTIIVLFICINSHSQIERLGGIPERQVVPIKRSDNKQLSSELKIVDPNGNGNDDSTGTTVTGNSSEVGVTEGELSVSLTGGATYTIPIATPPGINGVVPQVSLIYNSQSGNGLAGYGWNISGVSVITRIPTTRFHDDTIDPVDFNSQDKFALDGQRLLLKNGASGTYGSNGAIYETESFSNLKITSYGVHPNGANYGPAYFLVEYPDGSIAQYGNSTDSVSLTDWAITYWQNPQGVRILYSYNSQNNNLSISSIKYGARFTNIPINEISFIYRNRLRPEQAYIGGQSLIKSTILSEIRVKGNNLGFRNYILVHESTSLGYERLKSITEKSGDNTKSFNPTIFKYDTTSENVSFNTNTANININTVRSDNSATVSGDFNGDGSMDFILYPTTGTDAKKKYWLFTNIQGTSTNIGYEHNLGKFDELFPISWLGGNAGLGYKLMPMQGWCAITNNTSTSTTSFTSYSTGTTNPILLQDAKSYIFPKYDIDMEDLDYSGMSGINLKDITKKYASGDFNGDGISDLIAIEQNSSFYICTKYGKSSPTSKPPCVEGYFINYTGQSYFINLDKRLASNYVNISGIVNLNASSRLEVADFNGDGKSDVYVFDNGSCRVYTLNDSNQLILITTISSSNITTNKPVLMGDYNGDGKSDFIIPKENLSNLFTKYISTGINVVSSEVDLGIGAYFTGTYDGNESIIQYIIPNDFNNDGKTDLVLAKCKYLYSGYVDYVNQSRFISVRYFGNKGNTFESSMYAVKMDVNGLNHFPIPIFLSFDKANSNQQISFISNNNVYTAFSPKDNIKDNQLKEITIGNGVKDRISYSRLSYNDQSINPYDSTFMPSQYVENYPNLDIKIADNFQIVSKLEKISSNKQIRQTFKYFGAVTSVNGLGFLGFRGLARTNWYDDNHTAITSVSKHDISKRGSIYETFSILGEVGGDFVNFSPTSFIDKNTMNYSDVLLGNKVYKISNTSSISLNGLEGTSKEISTTYDVNNNPLITTILFKNGTTVEKTEINTITYYPSVTSPTYYSGRINKKNTSITHNGDTMTAEEVFTYNTEHLVSKIQKKGHLTNYITEDNVFDVFGNITKKTITVVGLQPRETNFVYDISGRFLINSLDLEGLSTSFTYDNSTGLLLSKTLPSIVGYPMTYNYTYDVWGKKIKETDYKGGVINIDYSWLSAGSYASGSYAISESGNDNSYNVSWFDDSGRKVVEGVRNINDVSYVQANMVWKYYDYDIYDRIYNSYEPELASTPQWSSSSNSTEYDEYGRAVKIIEHTGKTTVINYVGLLTTVSDGVNTTNATKNSFGNIISKTDNGGTIIYQYYANGNLKQSIFGTNTISIEQDGWGRKTKLIDPNAGTYQYTYNDFGETLSEITPKGITSYSIDDVGKISQKTIMGTSGTPTNVKNIYNYDPITKLLNGITYNDIAGNYNINYNYTYDNFKRLIVMTETTPNILYKRETKYDVLGRPEKEFYSAIETASGKRSEKWIKNTYKNGAHWQIIDDITNQVLWQTSTVNERGKLIKGNYGNGIELNNTYDSYGYPVQFKNDISGTTTPLVNLFSLSTAFEPQHGNLLNRTNSLFNVSETFTYDNLDRLKTYPDKAGIINQQDYDNLGRINNNEVGTYNYTNVDPITSTLITFQNSSISTTPNYTSYYSNSSALDITYNAFKSPIDIIEQGKDLLSFVYNSNNRRSVMYYGGLQNNMLLRPLRKHFSIDGSMEVKQNINSGSVEFITYIGGDAYTAPIILKSDGTTQNWLYLHRDYLGSIVAITNQSGNIIEKRHFDAWGNISKLQDGNGNNLNGLTVIDRGYTGHEHLQSVGLINMNGRLYDPVFHRFLQPDNFVQDPFNTQNFNRYSYVLNNPLKYSDISGELFWTPILVGAIIGAISGGVSYISNAIRTGDWSWRGFGLSVGTGALIGGITGGVSPMSIFSAGGLGQIVVSSFAAGFMPMMSVPIGNWNFSISPSFAFGNASGFGVNMSLGYNDGNWSFAYGIGIMEYGNYNGFGKNSLEVRNSIIATWDDGRTGVSFGTNFWSGDFKQQVGMLGLHFGDFRAVYENDGKPFSGINADGNDQYRTAALSLSVSDVSIGFNLFTGIRTHSEYEAENSGNWDGYVGEVGGVKYGQYGETYKNGLVKEVGKKYRLGTLTVGYKGYKAGIDSEWIRHGIQNIAIHGTFVARQRMFEMQSGNVNGYFQYKTPNIFTTW